MTVERAAAIAIVLIVIGLVAYYISLYGGFHLGKF